MKVDTYPLQPPSLEELAKTITPALQSNFTSSSVTVAPCPDLTQPPFYLAGSGLSGSERIADVGGQHNLYNMPNFDAKYSLPSIAKHIGMFPSSGFMLGSGAGPFHVLGQNAELTPNLSWKGGFDEKNITNRTHYAKIDGSRKSGQVVCESCPSTDCALMCNLFASEGKPGDVLKVTANSRTGPKNFTDCIRNALTAAYGDERPVSLGGVFVIKTGKAKLHVMPDFPPKEELPFESRKAVDEWLRYFDFEAPLVCLTVFHSADPGAGLRMEHTHCFSEGGEGGGNRGGHYHYDLDDGQGEPVEYEAYLNMAKAIYRVDPPAQPFMM